MPLSGPHGSSGGDGHPDAERLAEYIDLRLSRAGREEVQAHLARCADCRAMVADAIQMATSDSLSDHSLADTRASRRGRYWLAAASLAAAAVVLAAVMVGRFQSTRARERAIKALVAAVDADRARPFEGRLSGFGYAPPRSPTRGGGSRDASPGIRIAAAEIEKITEHEDSPDAVAARGMAYAVTGRFDLAASALESAAARAPMNAQYPSDLSAIYLARADVTGRRDDLVAAASSAERALTLDPTAPEACFNRALALERLSGAAQAREMWQRCLAREAAPPWSAEMRTHVAAARPAP